MPAKKKTKPKPTVPHAVRWYDTFNAALTAYITRNGSTGAIAAATATTDTAWGKLDSEE